MPAPKLSELARLERNRYQREYRAAHKEQVKESNRKYWAKRALKRKEAENYGKTETDSANN